MPLKYLELASGEVVTPEAALDKAAKRLDETETTYEILSAMLDAQQDRGDRISTTTLTAKCPRSEFLKRTTDYTEPLARLYPSFRGTLVHALLERAAHPRTIVEARYHADTPHGPLSGSPDLVDPHAGVLYDYKTTKEAPRYGPWPDQVEQVQINRWLVDHAHTIEFNNGGPKVTIEITEENRHLYVPVEWQGLVLIYLDDKGPTPMVVTRSEEVIGKTTGRPKKVRVPDVWDDERVEKLIAERYAVYAEAFETGKVPPIPAGWEHQSHVLCSYCPVRSQCAQLESEGR